MPSFTYTGDDTRYYPSLGLVATPGITLDLAEAPTDGRWSAPAGTAPAPAAPAADPAPAAPDLAN